MLVEIYSDVVCPWCAIGKARFETALAQFPDRDQVEVVWRAFQLDPTAPAVPTPVIDGYARKFGGPEKAKQIIETVTAAAAGEGIDFHMDIALRANTFDAHRLLWFVLEHHGSERQGEMKARLLRAYFTEGLNVADHGVLASLAMDIGLDGGAVAAFLDSAQGMVEVREELDGAHERGVSAVPTFVFEGQWAVPGAQDPEVFLRVFDRLQTRAREAAAIGAGDACAVDARAVNDPNC